jgi:hypothetical protein
MHKRNLTAGIGLASLVLWIVGLVLQNTLPDKIPSSPSDAQLLTWVQSNSGDIIAGSWLFMCGCVLFIAFAVALRSHLPEGPLTTAFYTSLVVGSAFGIVTASGDFATAIDKDAVSATTAGAFHHLGDIGFVGVELSLVLAFGAAALLAFRTASLPRWWGAVCGLFAVVAVIGPIGWTMVVFGLPLWTLVTPWGGGPPPPPPSG